MHEKAVWKCTCAKHLSYCFYKSFLKPKPFIKKILEKNYEFKYSTYAI